MKIKEENIFVSYLALLGLRYTESFSNQYFNEHPHKYNLFGFSDANHFLETAKFSQPWTCVVLFDEYSERSIEPNYTERPKTELIDLLKQIALLSTFGLIAILTYIYNIYYTNAGITLLLCVNFAGLFISWMLFMKQMKEQSEYSNKICSQFKRKDCTFYVLNRNALGLFYMNDFHL